MNEQQVIELIRQELEKREKDQQFSVTPIPFHMHNGVDSAKINPASLMGFPVRTQTPTDSPLDGTIVLSDISGTRKIWARINNAWYSVTIT